jgi:hypothetical protein
MFATEVPAVHPQVRIVSESQWHSAFHKVSLSGIYHAGFSYAVK